MIRYAFSYFVIYLVWLIRQVLSLDGRSYLVLSAPQFQSFLAWIARLRSYAVFYKAKVTCPAYKAFLKAENFNEKAKWRLESVPIMTKENYVKKYSIEERCYGGKNPGSRHRHRRIFGFLRSSKQLGTVRRRA